MAKLYFKYGVMGSSKTAQALIAKFNYEENKKRVLLLKPATDDRDGADTIKSRIGLKSAATVIGADNQIPISLIANYDVIICDESQFFSPEQIERLKDIAVFCDIPVLCYGLLTDFQTKLFPGSKRLIELADSLQEIKMVCRCGRKATVNARRIDGEITTEGEQILLGSNETYEAMCYECWRNEQVSQSKLKC